MYTVQSSSYFDRPVVYGHYGTFDDLAEATRVAANVWRIGSSKYGITDASYRAVPVPDGVTPKPIHPKYLD